MGAALVPWRLPWLNLVLSPPSTALGFLLTWRQPVIHPCPSTTQNFPGFLPFLLPISSQPLMCRTHSIAVIAHLAIRVHIWRRCDQKIRADLVSFFLFLCVRVIWGGLFPYISNMYMHLHCSNTQTGSKDKLQMTKPFSFQPISCGGQRHWHPIQKSHGATTGWCPVQLSLGHPWCSDPAAPMDLLNSINNSIISFS